MQATRASRGLNSAGRGAVWINDSEHGGTDARYMHLKQISD